MKASETTDSGLALSTRTRFREGGGMDLNMISVGGDFGTVTFGNQWNLSHLNQLSEASIATVAGGGFVQADTGTPMDDMNSTGFLLIRTKTLK